MQNPATPFYDEANSVTCQTSAAVTGKRFVAVSGSGVFDDPTIVAHASGAADQTVHGVTAYDAPTGAMVTVYTSPAITMPVEAGVALVAGQNVQSDAQGRAIPLAAGTKAGVALKDAAAGAEAKIKLTLS